MADTDPFVKRMLARSEARRAALYRLADGGIDSVGKENGLQNTAGTVLCRHKGAEAAISEDASAIAVLQQHNRSCVPQLPCNSNGLQIPAAPPLPQLSDRQVSSPAKSHNHSEKNNFSQPNVGRLTALARRQQQMQQWDDDYTYHSTNLDLKIAANQNNEACATAVPAFSNNVHALQSSSECGTKPNCASPSKVHGGTCLPSSSMQTYHFGEAPIVSAHCQTKVANTDLDAFTSSGASTKLLPTAGLKTSGDMSPSSKMLWDRKMIDSLEAQGFTPTSSHSRLIYDFNKESKEQISDGSKDHEKEQLPISGARLQQDYNSNAAAHETSSASVDGMQSPLKVVSCILKRSSTSNSPAKQTSAPVDDNLGSVQKLRNRWEQQIREYSPDRFNGRRRSCSPNRQTIKTASPDRLGIGSSSPTRQAIRATSPARQAIRASSPDRQAIRASSPDRQAIRASSPDRRAIIASSPDCQAIRASSPDRQAIRASSHVQQAMVTSTSDSVGLRPASPNKYLVEHRAVGSTVSVGIIPEHRSVSSCQRGRDQSSARHRTVSPSKSVGALVPHPPICRSTNDTLVAHQGFARDNIVKGERPMPPTQPLLQEPHQCSVRARAAAFTSVMDCASAAHPTLDPAELSLHSRRQLFEKRGEDALLPKAPFGQPVSAKVLNEGSGAALTAAASRPHTSATSSGPRPRAATAPLDQLWRHRRIGTSVAAAHRILAGPAEESDSDSYPESNDSYQEDDTSSYTSTQHSSPGPPKPPRSYTEKNSPSKGSMAPPAPPPPPSSANAHSMASSSPSHSPSNYSPAKKFEPRFKPGCLYPGLSDIESQSEADHEEMLDDSMTSIATFASGESLGTKIQQVAQSHRTEQLRTLHEDKAEFSDESSDDAGTALDEAPDESVTPPKRYRDEQTTGDRDDRGQYKTPRLSNSPDPRHTPGNPHLDAGLAHTVSMYRKRRPAEVSYTPVRPVVPRSGRGDVLTTSPAPAAESPSVTATARIKQLADTEQKELRIISQASVALSVAEQRPEQRGAAHHVEAEKLLLLATHRRHAVLGEVQRVKTEASMGGQGWAQQLDTNLGNLSISNISVPLSQDFLNKGIHECNQHLVVLVKQREQVLSSAVQSTPSCVMQGTVTFPDTLTLERLTPDFTITLEVYALKLVPAVTAHGHLKKDPSRMKLTPLKRLQQQHSRGGGSPACTVSSPGGPNAVRTSSFTLAGFTHLTISTLGRSAWTLDKVPLCSPLSGHLRMLIQCRMEHGVQQRGFLTVFQDVSGLGAWARRWAALDGPAVRFWSYPDQEGQKCLAYVPLKLVSSRRVQLVSRDVCARPHTFLLTSVSATQAGDTNTLVTELVGNTTITRHLLSADSAEECAEWCRQLNVALANIRAWHPDAARPDDYNV